MKICSTCKHSKPKSEFHKDKKTKDGLERRCKSCLKIKCRIYREKNRELLNKKSKDKYNKDIEKSRKYAYKQKRTLRGRYTQNKGEVIRANNHVWEISFEDFKEIHKDNKCTYCLQTMLKTCGSGLDRIDSSKGYVLDNVVACCYICNRVKSNIFNFDEMKELGKVINKINKERKK